MTLAQLHSVCVRQDSCVQYRWTGRSDDFRSTVPVPVRASTPCLVQTFFDMHCSCQVPGTGSARFDIQVHVLVAQSTLLLVMQLHWESILEVEIYRFDTITTRVTASILHPRFHFSEHEQKVLWILINDFLSK